MGFPVTRMRRLRRSETLRSMVRETRIAREDLILPLFVVEGSGVREPISSMPGVHRFSVDQVVIEAERVRDLGVPAIILFGIPDTKDARGSGADEADGIVQRASRAIVDGVPDLVVITDVCLCEYTDHGHCGTLDFGDRRGYQMDPPNRREAMREMRLDLEEGADMLMVKPAMAYLDILADARREFEVPLAAYQVSGEYSMIKAAGERGWIDADRAMEEAIVSIKRAGADMILTYAAADIAEKL